MLDRIAKTLCPPVVCLAGTVMLFSMPYAHAQRPATKPVSPANFDPSEVYFQAYLARRDAEKLEAQGDFLGASEKLKQANKLIEGVRTYYPGWRPEMTKSALNQNFETLTRIFPDSEKQRKKNSDTIAELEGGIKASGTTIDPSEGVMPLTPGILEVNPLETRRLAEAEAEVKRLQELADKNRNLESEASRNDSRVRDIARQRDSALADLKAAEANLQSLRARLASRPIEDEVKALNDRINEKELERQAMGKALQQSRGQYQDALSRIATLEADLNVLRQKHSDLDRDMKIERETANSVVAGQRAQIQALEKQLASKDVEIGKANETIAQLSKQLEESNAINDELRTERDNLLAERDRMSALLKLNEDGRIQDLIEQNMSLAKNLREANERVEFLNNDSNTAKDDFTQAQRDLAIAKEQINRLHREKREQDARLAELESRLRDEESALTRGEASGNPEEMAILRDIIQRQLRVQERRRQARDLLVEAAKEMGTQDERLNQALELFDGQEIQLSPDEQRLLADRNVDGEFVSPFAQDGAIVGRNTARLNQDVAVFERTAEKSFAAGRMLSTRELFEMIVEQHPGHIPALCKLGVVHLRLDDPLSAADSFRRAVELDSENPYAHRMLAFSLMKSGDIAGAEETLKETLTLAPDDTKSLMLLGVISQGKGQLKDAEGHYKTAITSDPLLSEPYYNLAVICSKTNRIDEAKDYYNQALERGALPDPALEELLAKS